MKKYIFIICLFIVSCVNNQNRKIHIDQSEKVKYLKQVSFLDVKINDNFWSPIITLNRVNGIPAVFDECSYSLDNFDIAAGKMKGEHKGTAASDSDVYKIIQGVAYALHHTKDNKLEEFTDNQINRIVDAQQADGYLYTYWTINDPSMKWVDIERKHELYCAGHMFEAAVAYYRVTGKRKLLDAAIRFANHIDSVFGPGKRIEVPGHQEIELALYKLYQVTGDEKYLNLSEFFIGERGNPERMADDTIPPEYDPNAGKPSRWRHPSYRQDHLPVEKQYYATGHAVRAAYLYSAMTDLALESHSGKYIPALDSIWKDIVTRKLYVTGGIGTRQFHDEGFGTSFRLPSSEAYCETCSAIALTFWNRRMNLLHGDARHADLLEWIMYNAGISGVSLEGDMFFYTNPLESEGKNKRRPWYEPGCCPSNMVRFLPETGSNIYAKNESEIYLNQFIGSESDILLDKGLVNITQVTAYPWDGNVKIHVDPEASFDFKLHIRIPGWARGELLPGDLYNYSDSQEENNDIILKINGERIDKLNMDKGYAVIDRIWDKGDIVELSLPMDVRLITGSPNIEDVADKVVISRGPIVYCIEEADNEKYFDDTSEALLLPQGFTSEYRDDMLGGIVAVKGYASLLTTEEVIDITAIPYYAWCNREPGHMKVWLPVTGQ